MNGGIGAIGREDNPAKIGIIISAVVIFGSLLPNIEIYSFKITFPDSMFMFLAGASMLFYFMSIKVNMNESFDGKSVWYKIPVNRSPLSREILGISIIIFIMAMARLAYVILASLLI